MQNSGNGRATYSPLFVVVTGLFIAALIAANIISVKIIAIGDWYVPAGVIVFPLSYIFGDVLTEVYGYARARKVVWAGFGAIIFASFMSWIVVSLRPADGWHET